MRRFKHEVIAVNGCVHIGNVTVIVDINDHQILRCKRGRNTELNGKLILKSDDGSILCEVNVVGVAKNTCLALLKKLGDVYIPVIEGCVLEINGVVGANSANRDNFEDYVAVAVLQNQRILHINRSLNCQPCGHRSDFVVVLIVAEEGCRHRINADVGLCLGILNGNTLGKRSRNRYRLRRSVINHRLVREGNSAHIVGRLVDGPFEREGYGVVDYFVIIGVIGEGCRVGSRVRLCSIAVNNGEICRNAAEGNALFGLIVGEGCGVVPRNTCKINSRLDDCPGERVNASRNGVVRVGRREGCICNV